jgi:hypothetical protein
MAQTSPARHDCRYAYTACANLMEKIRSPYNFTGHFAQLWKNARPPHLQKAVNRIAKGRVLHAKRWPFRSQKATFCKPSDNTLALNRLRACSKTRPVLAFYGHECSIGK